MSIIRAAVGSDLEEFDEHSTLEDVWAFINLHMDGAEDDKAIVLMDDSGETIGQIWHSSQYYALWGTPSKMRAYFNLIGFDQDE